MPADIFPAGIFLLMSNFMRKNQEENDRMFPKSHTGLNLFYLNRHRCD